MYVRTYVKKFVLQQNQKEYNIQVPVSKIRGVARSSLDSPHSRFSLRPPAANMRGCPYNYGHIPTCRSVVPLNVGTKATGARKEFWVRQSTSASNTEF